MKSQKEIYLVSPGVATKTGHTFKLKSWNFIVFFCHLLCIVVFMAIDTAKNLIVLRLKVTICTIVPLALMFTRVYGKVGVVRTKAGWPPTRGQSMTELAIGRKIGMIHTLWGIDQWSMTAYAIGIQSAEAGWLMTCGTIQASMALLQREKTMKNLPTLPAIAGYRMTNWTIGWKLIALVIGFFGSQIFCSVTVETSYSSWCKIDKRGILMTHSTVLCCVHPD